MKTIEELIDDLEILIDQLKEHDVFGELEREIRALENAKKGLER